MCRPDDLDPVETIPAYAVIIRAIWERGPIQQEALAELDRRGLWLTDDQKLQAGLACRLTRSLPRVEP